MALPKIDLPLFDITIPSTEQKTKFRPFTVKEEKILLIAQESKDIDQIITSIKQIINNTVQDVDVDKLAMFDLEYLLLNIRAKSVNNIIEFTIPDPEDNNRRLDLQFDIENVQLKHDEKHNKNIKINDEAYLIMRYPSLNEIKHILESNMKEETLFNILLECFETIVNKDEVYNVESFTREEVIEFVDQLSNNVINDMKQFFETVPTMRIEIPYKNKDGEDKTFVIEGMDSFFI